MSERTVFVAGAGLMGHGIAQVLAAAGHRVILYEPEEARATAGRQRIADNLARAVAKGRLEAGAADEQLQRIEATRRIGRVVDADVVIEAVFEDVDVKRALWADLDRQATAPAIFATNTSSISIDSLASAVSADRRARFVGMHFFSPVPVMPLVELIPGSETDAATVQSVRDLSAELGKQVIVSADRPGFIVNRILMPLLGEAMRAHDEGLGTAEDIDAGARVGLNHPMGPLELADFIGLDVCLNIMRVLHEGLGGAQFAPPRGLIELVTEGHLGQKTGRGFYTYPREPREPRAGRAG